MSLSLLTLPHGLLHAKSSKAPSRQHLSVVDCQYFAPGQLVHTASKLQAPILAQKV